jgi:RNA polymerase sigma-70 factor (ECF subfamily)
VKVWRNLKKFDQKKNFKTWIFHIAKNASFDFFKKKRANEEGENTIIETLSDPAPLPDGLLGRAGVAEMLNAVMKKLSPQYRMVLFLRYNDHFTLSGLLLDLLVL